MNKYRAKKVVSDGITFDSKVEERRYQQLKLMERSGEIQCLKVHVPFRLLVNNIRVADYEADFTYERRGSGRWEFVVEDVKGVRLGAAWAMFRLKAKMFSAQYGQEIEVYPPALLKPRRRV